MFVDIKTPDLVADKIQDISYFNSQNYIKKILFSKAISLPTVFMFISFFIIPFIRLQLLKERF